MWLRGCDASCFKFLMRTSLGGVWTTHYHLGGLYLGFRARLINILTIFLHFEISAERLLKLLLFLPFFSSFFLYTIMYDGVWVRTVQIT